MLLYVACSVLQSMYQMHAHQRARLRPHSQLNQIKECSSMHTDMRL